MSRIVYHVVLPFERSPLGRIMQLDPYTVDAPDDARRRVQALVALGKGGIAFTRRGDTDLGVYEDAEIILADGVLPTDIERVVAA